MTDQQIGNIVTQIIGDWPRDIPVLRRPIIKRIVEQTLKLAALALPEAQPTKKENA